MTLIEPSPLELRCQASGTPTPILSWTMNGHPLISTARVHHHLLAIEPQLSSTSSTGNVIFINEHGNIVNESATAAAAVAQENQSFLMERHRHHRGRVQQSRTNDGGVLVSLVIALNATEKKVSGNYVCTALNAVGRDEAVLRLNVLGE